MSDRGPFGQDPEPTEAFPPLPPDSSPTPEGLPPIGSERDPEPTTVMPPLPPGPPTESGIPTTAMPTTGGPFEPGPPYGGEGGGGGGGDEPPFDQEPEPWYRQPGPLAALIAGVAALIVVVVALIIWSQSDDDDTGPTLPSIESTTSTTSSTSSTSSTTSTTVPETTTSSSTTTSTTTTVPETTTTLPPTTTTLPPPTTAATTTTAAPTTTTTAAPTTTVPPGRPLLAEIAANSDLETFADALACTKLDADVLSGKARTVLAPDDAAFTAAGINDPCADPNAIAPILMLHLVSVDLDAQDLFGANELQTLGGPVPVNRTSQTIGSLGAKVTDSVQAGDGYVHTLDKIIQS